MGADHCWAAAAPAAAMPIRDDEVHLWRVRLDRGAAELARLRSTLAADEVERAERFRFNEHRNAFIVARGALRAILARYCEIAAEKIEFAYAYAGKPRLAREAPEQALAFNLSHSGHWAVAAVMRRRTSAAACAGQPCGAMEDEIGVDVEALRPMSDLAGIARRYFAPAEVAAWERLPEDRRLAAFFRCWTRKEAYLKALGDGLRAPLDAFEVSIEEDEPRLLQYSPHDELRAWTMSDVPVEQSYVAAAVMPARCRVSQWWEFRDETGE
jgi:4'-phosphopantetheinyl transferase